MNDNQSIEQRLREIREREAAATKGRDAKIAELEQRLDYAGETFGAYRQSATTEIAALRARVAELERSIGFCSGSCGFPGQVSDSGMEKYHKLVADNKRLRAALAELVACKDLKERTDKWIEYINRNAAAWAKAREVLG